MSLPFLSFWRWEKPDWFPLKRPEVSVASCKGATIAWSPRSIRHGRRSGRRAVAHRGEAARVIIIKQTLIFFRRVLRRKVHRVSHLFSSVEPNVRMDAVKNSTRLC